MCSIVALHRAGVDAAVVSGLDVDATPGSCMMIATVNQMVDPRLLADVLDGVVDLGDLISTIVG